MVGALPLVGRRAEVEFLADALAPVGEPRTVVIVGEAGVGKTRLVEEAIARARAADVKVLTGTCLPLHDNLPFLPVTEALRGIDKSDRHPVPFVVERCPVQVRAELARLIPAWLRR
ncbi:AAA ATPase-like protein [Asanoa ferruginea]|uniref:AAA ATPase-like protein n=1 Tax=Asanoa ferruginea TaxID=53367 RepID=A0A3D9ZU58_9ACTN|nr:AAA family ATPase [Asanoa ferruginea]REG00937.1 AAA ATPase-like protein [Asanoa ferruginea]GIF47528.1 hypothetical protein Afe04nite_20670 [Asanoa ferruginea]